MNPISRWRRRLWASGIVATLAVAPLTGAWATLACVGDCGGDGAVTVDEIVTGVNIALGTAPVAGCRRFDRDGSGSVTVDELLAGVSAALEGCLDPTATPTFVLSPTSTPPASPTVTTTPTATATVTDSPTSTPTPTAPSILLPTPQLYRGFAGYPIAFDVGARHLDGLPLVYTPESLPDEATLDTDGVFGWTPASDQVGAATANYVVAEAGVPQASQAGALYFSIEAPDSCSTIHCEPALGCTSTLASVTEQCCEGTPEQRPEDPNVVCPAGKAIRIGRNIERGFGRLYNCDQYPVLVFDQTGAAISFHVMARCLDTSAPVTIRARFEATREGKGATVLVDDSRRRELVPTDDGFWVEYGVLMAVDSPGPYFDLQDAEANLHIEVEDRNADKVEDDLRLRITFTKIPDLPDPPTPTATPLPPES